MVLDLTRVLAGPYATMLLADMGANVIKIEQPEKGDDSRQFGPFINNESAYFMSLNRNKRSITLNLKKPEGKEILKKLVAKADVLVENYRPGTMEKLGLGYDELKSINPGLIYASCSGYGHSGPWSQKPAYDIIIQATGGIMSITGQEGGEPTRVGASIGDITAGLFTAIGILEALYYREKTGEGQKVDVAMMDCQVAILENAIAQYFASGKSPVPIGNRHPTITPFEAFATKTNHIVIAAGNDSLWEKLCRAIGREQLINDPRFATNYDRTKNHSELKPLLQEAFLTKSCDEWIAVLEETGIPCGAINSVEDVIKHPQVCAREMIASVNHPTAGKVNMAGVPIKMSKTPGSIFSPPPLLGQHTREVLQDIGYSDEAIEELKLNNIV